MRPKVGTPEHVAYVVLHRHLRRIRGSATVFHCVDCNRQAQEWSFTHDTDPNDYENYSPRCKSCHRKYDCTEESRAKMSASRKGKATTTGYKHTVQTKDKMSKAGKAAWAKNTNRKNQVSAKLKGNQHLLGHKHSSETRAKMRASRAAYLERQRNGK